MPRDLYSTRIGSGRPMVLLHPIGLDGSFWKDVQEEFSGAYEVTAIDLAGRGKSLSPPVGYRLSDYADDVAAFMAGLKAPALVVGLSFGGMLAQVLSVRHPKLVSELVLCGCPCRFDDALRPLIAERGILAEKKGMGAVVDATLDRWFTPAFRESEAIKAVKQRLLSNAVDGWAIGWRAISDLDTTDVLKTIKVPTLCIAGGEDQSVPPAAVAEIAQRISGAEITVIPEASHMMHIENSIAFNRALAPFVIARAKA